MPKYINPYTDFGFKKLFGEEASAPNFQKAFEEGSFASITAHQQYLIHYWDMKSVIDTAVEEAVEKAVAKAIVGVTEQTQIDIAKAMLANGEPIEKIELYTQLTVAQIQVLQSK
jgi:hypothetical protein